MMTIYRWENGGLKETSDLCDSCWINLAEPSTAELEQVLTYSQVPRDFLTDPLDREERPRFESEDGFSLVIVHVPYPVRGEEDDETVLPFETIPLGIVLFGKSVITICSQATPVTGAFLDQIRRVCPPADQNRFLFRLLWHAAVLFLRYLRDMHVKIEDLEDDLHESIRNEALLKLLTYQKSLVYFSTSLKADNILMNRLDHARQLNMTRDRAERHDGYLRLADQQQPLERDEVHDGGDDSPRRAHRHHERLRHEHPSAAAGLCARLRRDLRHFRPARAWHRGAALLPLQETGVLT